MVPIQGWITLDTATDLFKRAGLDYDAAESRRQQAGLQGRADDGRNAQRDAHSTISNIEDAQCGGRDARARSIRATCSSITAHWDHLGVKPDVAGPDKIYNGAVDNGMGISMVLEIAEKFAHDQSAPQRSVGFMPGRWKSRACWARNISPSIRFGRSITSWAASISMPICRRARRTTWWSSATAPPSWKTVLAAALKTQDRVISPDPEPEKGGFYRSDHFSLAKVGMPMLYPGGGYRSAERGQGGGQGAARRISRQPLSSASDEWQANWDLSGPVSDLQVLYTVGNRLANSNDWPDWYEGNEFRAIRDKSMAGRQRN